MSKMHPRLMRMNSEYAEFQTLLNRTSVQCFDFRILPNSLLLRPFFFFFFVSFLAFWLFINNHEVLFVCHLYWKWREKPRPENRIAIRDWPAWPTWLASGYNFVGRAAKHCNIFSSSRIVGHNVWSKSNSIQHLVEQKMLDEHHPTWAPKRSNNVGSSRVGTLNPTLLDSLTGLHKISCGVVKPQRHATKT